MKKLIALLFVLINLPGEVSSQIAFEKKYQNSSYSFLVTIPLALDGGFLLIGNVTDTMLPPISAILKINQEGSPVSLDMRGAGIFTDACKTADNNIIIAGEVNIDPLVPNSEEYIEKTDTNTNPIWSFFNYNSYGYITKVCATIDSGVVYSAVALEYGKYNTHIVKLDVAGNKQWSCYLGDTITQQFTYDIKQTSDGGYIAAGYIDSTDKDMVLTKINAAGTQLWAKIYSETPMTDDEAVSILENVDSGFTVLGYTNFTDKVFFRTDSQGNVIWSNRVSNFVQSSPNHGYIQPAPNGNYYVNGIVPGASICEIDPSGNIVASICFEQVNPFDHFPFLQINNDFLFVSYDTNYTTYALKTNKANSCLAFNVPVNPNAITLSVRNGLSIWSVPNDSLVAGWDSAFAMTVTEDTLCLIRTNGTYELFESQINVSPNPVTNNLQIDLINSMTSNITIINCLDQIIFTGQTSDVKFNLNVSDFADGIYYCRIQSGNHITTKRFIKN